MGKLEKAKERLLSEPADYTYNELTSLLNRLGYKEIAKGKTSGSKVKFFNPNSKGVIMIHKPHPTPIVKRYVIKEIIKNLKENEEI